MNECHDEGRLRAYLDEQLLALEFAAVANHLTGCENCRRSLSRLRETAEQVRVALPQAPAPDPDRALARFRASQPSFGGSVAAKQQGKNPMKQPFSLWSGPRRGLVAGAVATLLALSLLALPPVRAAAADFLQLFRVQSVLFVPVSEERVQQLQNIDLDGRSLFLAEPEFSEPVEPRSVASAEELSREIGFAVAEPRALPDGAAGSYALTNSSTATFQVDVESAQQIIELLGVTGETLPPALGQAPIVVEVPNVATANYRLGNGDTLRLTQGQSPDVTLPDGVELDQLGKIALRIYGVDPVQAELMSAQIDWTSTLVFPIPTDARNIRQVPIGDVQGLLVNSRSEDGPRAAVLYWQRGDRFFVLEGRGLGDGEMVAAAESVQ